MPSKRKKNKRRMRRVQAQRRALEEQHAVNSPIKASSGMATSAPPKTTPKKAAKTLPPTQQKLPQTIPISVPIEEPPKVEPEPVLKEDAAEAFQVEVAAAESDVVLLTQATPELEVEYRVADEVEGPAHVTKEAPVESSPLVEPSIVEADLAKEAEVAVSETEPFSEVAAPEEAPVVVVADADIGDNEVIQTEMDQTHDVCEADSEKAVTLAEEDSETKEELEVTITEEATMSESITEATEEPVVEDLTSDQHPTEVEPAAEKTETDTGSEVQDVTETLDPAKKAEKVSPKEPPEDGEEKLEDLVEEDSAGLSVDSVTAAKDVPAPSVEIPAQVLNTITETPLDEADPPVDGTTEGAADLLINETAVTASESTVKDVVSTSTIVQLETEGTGDIFTTQAESMGATTFADPEGDAAAPTGEVGTNPAVDHTFLDVMSEETKSGGCDVTCQVQLPVEAVQLGAVELSVEITQNGNIAPEVSIEG